jgi:hypothetical protein
VLVILQRCVVGRLRTTNPRSEMERRSAPAVLLSAASARIRYPAGRSPMDPRAAITQVVAPIS